MKPMKRLVEPAAAVCCFFLLFSPVLQAQQEPATQLDDRPILATIPEYARWLITLPEQKTKAPSDEPKASGGSSGKEDDGTTAEAAWVDVSPTSILVSKVGEYYHEAFTWSNGQKSERWYFQGLALAHPTAAAARKGSKSKGFKLGLALRPGAESNEMPVGIDPLDPYYRALEKGPFPELAWMKKSDFKGEATVGGVKVLIFEGKDRLVFDDGSETYRTHAGIDAATRLPVFFEKDGLRRTYKFLPPPDSGMKPEGAFLKRVMQIRDQVHELTRMPARP